MNSSPRRPDFFIVGAPKAGTTSLYEYLRQHPQVFMPAAKELHYFGSDLEFRRTPRLSEDEYLKYFSSVPNQVLRVGEASVRYLQSEEAASEIASFCPDAAIIVMLRNPVDALPAMHSEYLFSGIEDIEDFGAALAAEPERRAGRRLPPGANVPQVLYYRESVRYADQVERYLRTFGRSQVHTILFDDLRADTQKTYRATLDFLGVSVDTSRIPWVANPNKVARSRLATRLVSNPPKPVRWAAQHLSRRARKRVYRWAMNLNARRSSRRPVPDELRRQLEREMRPEIERLAELIERDLSGWIQT